MIVACFLSKGRQNLTLSLRWGLSCILFACYNREKNI